MKKSQKNLLHIIYLLFTVLIVVSGAVALLVWQKSGVSTEGRAKASIACSGLVKKGKLNNVQGVVQVKNADDFTWQTGGVTKVVKVCNDTVFRRRYGGGGPSDAPVPMTYDQLTISDTVNVTGFYTDTTQTTIWPTLVLDTSIYRGEDKAATVTEIINASSFKVNVDYKLWGGVAEATVTLRESPTGDPAKCVGSLGGNMDCSLIQEGDKLKITGVFSATERKIAAWRVEDYSKIQGSTRGKISAVADPTHFTLINAKFFGQTGVTVDVELQPGAQCVLNSGKSFDCTLIGASFVGDDVTAEGALFESSKTVKANKLTDHSKRVFP